jgi:DNA-binding response OmpR family regulator
VIVTAVDAGVFGYLTKPVRDTDLIAAVAACDERRDGGALPRRPQRFGLSTRGNLRGHEASASRS